MKSRWINVFWGLVMIAIGVAFILNEQGIIDLNLISMPVVVLMFGVLSAFFFLTYFVQGVHHWGWLFPACILAGIALTIGLDGTVLGSALGRRAGVGRHCTAVHRCVSDGRKKALVGANPGLGNEYHHIRGSF